MDTVFIHRSIKTRIETTVKFPKAVSKSYVFIHRSIKTRIETQEETNIYGQLDTFLYIDPLKQGLKQIYISIFH